MHHLDESHIFLLQMLVLLGIARTLGAICEEVVVPAIAGEILAGEILGPTLLGRVAVGPLIAWRVNASPLTAVGEEE